MATFHDYVNDIHIECHKDEIEILPVFIFNDGDECDYDYQQLMDNLDSMTGITVFYMDDKFHYTKELYDIKFELDQDGDFELVVMEPK